MWLRGGRGGRQLAATRCTRAKWAAPTLTPLYTSPTSWHSTVWASTPARVGGRAATRARSRPPVHLTCLTASRASPASPAAGGEERLEESHGVAVLRREDPRPHLQPAAEDGGLLHGRLRHPARPCHGAPRGRRRLAPHARARAAGAAQRGGGHRARARTAAAATTAAEAGAAPDASGGGGGAAGAGAAARDGRGAR
eukprot:scaffold18703_cov42-Phaeocystis_antarctica.AAC.1